MQNYELQQNPLDLAAVDNRQRWQLRPPSEDFPAPWASSWGFDKYGLWQCFAIKGIEHKLRYIAPGAFLMGSPEDEPEREENELLHPVRITKGFWLGGTTVTQALWVAVMGENPSGFEDEDDVGLPVENVNWFDCREFCERVKQQNDGQLLLNLPTEAQWEYACRAGSQTPFNTGEQLSTEQANYDGRFPYNNDPEGEDRDKTIPVDSFQANAWGLKQMHGNVLEWCLDVNQNYNPELYIDPIAWAPAGPTEQAGQPDRVLRGGSWFNGGQICRSAYRYWSRPAIRGRRFGLRVTASK